MAFKIIDKMIKTTSEELREEIFLCIPLSGIEVADIQLKLLRRRNVSSTHREFMRQISLLIKDRRIDEYFNKRKIPAVRKICP